MGAFRELLKNGAVDSLAAVYFPCKMLTSAKALLSDKQTEFLISD